MHSISFMSLTNEGRMASNRWLYEYEENIYIIYIPYVSLDETLWPLEYRIWVNRR